MTSKELANYKAGSGPSYPVGKVWSTTRRWEDVLRGPRCPTALKARINENLLVQGEQITMIKHLAPFDCHGDEIKHNHMMCEYAVMCILCTEDGKEYHSYHTPGKCPASLYRKTLRWEPQW